MLTNQSHIPTLLQLRAPHVPRGVAVCRICYPIFITQAREQGMLLIKVGLRGNVVCILVPLGIEELLISRAIETLCTVIKQAA